MAESLEAYLNKTYSKVTKLSNGGYYCYDSNGDRLYVPANYNGSVGMLSYIPGAGGSWPNDAKQLDILIKSDNPPEYIISIAQGPNDDHKSLATSYSRLTSQGIQIDSVVEMTFSMSSGIGFERLNTFITNNPDVDCVMIINNGVKFRIDDAIRASSKYSALVESKTPILLNDPYSLGDMKQRTINGNNAGYNMVWLKSKSAGHIAFNADIISNRFVDYLMGYRESFNDVDTTGNRDLDYQLVTLDPTTGQLKTIGFDEVTLDALSKVGIPNLKKLLAYDSFDIKEELVPKTEETGTLSELSSILVKSPTGSISSSYYFVWEKMSDLRKSIKSSGYLSGLKNTTFRSASGIPGCIGKYISAYFKIVSTLLTNLSVESESVLSYAQAMVDMDDDMAAGATNLGSVVQLEYNGEKPSSTYVHKDPEDVYGDKKKDGDNDDGGNYYYGGNNGGGGGNETPKLQGVYEFEDGHRAYIKYDGDQISEFKYIYSFKTETEAQNAYSLFKDAYKNDEMIQTMAVNGKDVSILLKIDKVRTMTIEEIQNKLLKGAKAVND